MATRPSLYAIFALFPFFLALLLRPLHSDDVFSSQPNTIPSNPSRILLLTAHPDDETFFFGPTLTSLIPSSEASVSTSSASSNSIAHPFPQVYSLCFSVGNAYGLGEIRRREFEGSLDVIGVAKDKRWILDEPEFPDSITTKWNASLIAATVNRYVVDHNISTILTFDSYGATGHLNHISLYHGVSLLLATAQADIRDRLTAYSLKSKPIVIRYTGILAPLYVKLKMALSRAADAMGRSVKSGSSSSFDRPIFVAGLARYLRAVFATLQHPSQLVWFRWLYMAFSQHMWVNEWERIPVIEGGRVL